MYRSIFLIIIISVCLAGCGNDTDTDPASTSPGNIISNPLVVSDFLVTNITSSTAEVKWKTNLLSIYKIEYWPTNNSDVKTIDNTSPNFQHSQNLTGLRSGVSYSVKLYSKTGDGYAVDKSTNFNTL